MPLIDLSVPPKPARRRRPGTALVVLALASFLTGATGYAALRPAPASTAPDAVPEPPVAAAEAPSSPLGRSGVPAAAADPAHISPAPRS